MKRLLIALIALMPIALWAQDNSWEQPEDEQETAVETTTKTNPDAKYLRGAVPVVDGKVVFTRHIDAPGKTAAQVYDIIHRYLAKMTTERNQLEQTRLVKEDATGHTVAGWYEEWLVFKSTVIALDRTRFYYSLQANCTDGGADLTLSHIRYLYDEARDPQRYSAEEWIVDKEAVNKKNTRLQPLSGKFRRKTIDRKDYLFNKIESLLK